MKIVLSSPPLANRFLLSRRIFIFKDIFDQMNMVVIDHSINEGYYSQQTFSSNSYLSESRLMANNVMLEDHQSVWKCRRGNAQFNKFQRGLVVTKKYFLVLEDSSVGEKELKKFRVGGNSHFMMSRTARHLLNFCFYKNQCCQLNQILC